MPLPPLYGHEGSRNRLASAIAAGRLPQALLFEGPRGVGKQRLALWLAQALLCERGPEGPAGPEGSGRGEGCGTCHACKLVLNLSHPDLHWFVPLEPPKKAADAYRLVDLVADALAEEMAARREHPLYESPSGLATHGIAAVRLLLKRLALTPAMGRRKVFIIGDADRLVPQPGAEAAANALLKALEEPPQDTVFVLTTSQPDALLPTILSRVVRVSVARNSDSVLAAFARAELGVKSQREIAQRVAAADGCIGRLLASGRDAAASSESGGAARLLSALQGGSAHRYGFALAQQPFQARGGFTQMLDDLLGHLREQARAGADTDKVVEAIARVLDARRLAQGNVNPQLIAAVLGDDLTERA